MSDQELEVKFYVARLDAVEARLKSMGAHLLQPRTLEINLRFDTPDGDLTRALQVLRLRQDVSARLTYKGPPLNQGGARLRQEIEFEVSDFGAAKAFLQALGYQISIVYEKYRAAYELEGAEVSLDELPYGTFVEIEGPDPHSIRQLSERLRLDWLASIPLSYTALFDRLRANLALPFRDLAFKEFAGRTITVAELGVSVADHFTD